MLGTKRAFALCLGLGVIVVAAGCTPSSPTWPMFRYGPEHTGFTPSESKIGVDNVGSLREVWTASPTPGEKFYSSPAVVDGRVYIGSYDDRLYAFDAAGTTNCSGTPKTCSPLWATARLGGSVHSSPAVVDGMVYVAEVNGFLRAFDADDGASRWSFDGDSVSEVYSSPTVANGILYWAAADNIFEAGIYALDAKTGAELWKAKVPLVCSGCLQYAASPAVANGIVYIGLPGDGSDGAPDAMYAFDATGSTGCSGTPKTCAPLWTAPSAPALHPRTSPAVANGVVYTSETALRAFDAAGNTNCSGVPKTCAPLWFADAGGTSPAVANGVVYVGSAASGLRAFDAAGNTNCTGGQCSPLWSTVPTGTTNSFPSSPAVANGVVYVSSSTGVYAYDAAGVRGCSGSPKTCAPLWASGGTGFLSSSAAIANGVLYIGSRDSKLHAYALP